MYIYTYICMYIYNIITFYLAPRLSLIGSKYFKKVFRNMIFVKKLRTRVKRGRRGEIFYQ